MRVWFCVNIVGTQSHLAEKSKRVKKSFFSFTTDGAYKNKFPRQWIPSVFRIIVEPFSEQNQMMNSTMKLVRFKILQTYADVLKSMYTTDGKTDCKENLDALRKLM